MVRYPHYSPLSKDWRTTSATTPKNQGETGAARGPVLRGSCTSLTILKGETTRSRIKLSRVMVTDMRGTTGSSQQRTPPERKRISILTLFHAYLSLYGCLIGSMCLCMLFYTCLLMALSTVLSLYPRTTYCAHTERRKRRGCLCVRG